MVVITRAGARRITAAAATKTTTVDVIERNPAAGPSSRSKSKRVAKKKAKVEETKDDVKSGHVQVEGQEKSKRAKRGRKCGEKKAALPDKVGQREVESPDKSKRAKKGRKRCEDKVPFAAPPKIEQVEVESSDKSTKRGRKRCQDKLAVSINPTAEYVEVESLEKSKSAKRGRKCGEKKVTFAQVEEDRKDKENKPTDPQNDRPPDSSPILRQSAPPLPPSPIFSTPPTPDPVVLARKIIHGSITPSSSLFRPRIFSPRIGLKPKNVPSMRPLTPVSLPTPISEEEDERRKKDDDKPPPISTPTRRRRRDIMLEKEVPPTRILKGEDQPPPTISTPTSPPRRRQRLTISEEELPPTPISEGEDQPSNKDDKRSPVSTPTRRQRHLTTLEKEVPTTPTSAGEDEPPPPISTSITPPRRLTLSEEELPPTPISEEEDEQKNEDDKPPPISTPTRRRRRLTLSEEEDPPRAEYVFSSSSPLLFPPLSATTPRRPFHKIVTRNDSSVTPRTTPRSLAQELEAAADETECPSGTGSGEKSASSRKESSSYDITPYSILTEFEGKEDSKAYREGKEIPNWAKDPIEDLLYALVRFPYARIEIFPPCRPSGFKLFPDASSLPVSSDSSDSSDSSGSSDSSDCGIQPALSFVDMDEPLE
ncbi:cell surface glycoprotein 1 [Folsomia candida]|uniref:Uncharacterized protein n=1 Tax=Folsomia candida TaxID=158441 RepID=A0A226EHG9_FOLCA|nr:cell surface glycoprotein 1 [Folsomia candida]OXA56171.1 hypothetical protein Fcan01_08797 [Folsomia candida]